MKDRARDYIGKRGIADDSFNAVFSTQLEIRDGWKYIKPVETYAEYVRDKFRDNPELAEAIIAESDPGLVAQFDDKVKGINACIGDGVTTQAQADKIQILLNEIKIVIYGH